MDHTFTSTIDKLRVWRADGWKTYNPNNSKTSNFLLRIHYDQLFVMSDNKVLESLNLNGKMKSIYKDDVLILIFCNSVQQVRKIKFQIKTNISQCLLKLSLHLPVVNYNNMQSSHKVSKYKNIEEVLKHAIDCGGAIKGPPLPSSMKDFVKLCLLDPTFPQVVDETERILKDLVI